MTPKNYIHPTKLIKQITELAYKEYKNGMWSMIISTNDIIDLGGNPTYIKQYQKMLVDKGLTVASHGELSQTHKFLLTWNATLFKELIEADEKEAYTQLETEKVDAELNQIKYCQTDSPYHTTLAVAGKILQKLLTLSTNPTEILLTEQDIADLNDYSTELDLEELKDTLTSLGVSATLTEYSNLNNQQNTTLLINWHKSTLYHIVNS